MSTSDPKPRTARSATVRMALRARLTPLCVAALLAMGCTQPECSVNGDCMRAGAMCINGECVGPPCTGDAECDVGRCVDGLCRGEADAGAEGDAGRRDGGLRDAGSGEDAGLRDAGSRADGGGALDAGRLPDAGTVPDAGRDAGPPCACSPGQVETFDCGTCGQETRTCLPTCQWGELGPCTDTDARCASPASYCRSDVCWGYSFVTSGGFECIDLGTDYLPGDPTRYGDLDIEVFGRPGASWTKQNRHDSCGGDWVDNETGTLDGAGRDTYPTFSYGESDCSNGTLGQFRSRVRIDDGGDVFLLPMVYTHNFFNRTCAADRNTCDTVFDYCGL